MMMGYQSGLGDLQRDRKVLREVSNGELQARADSWGETLRELDTQPSNRPSRPRVLGQNVRSIGG